MIPASDDRDPPTEVMGVLEGVTSAGAPAALSLQHLHSLLTTLAPLRAAYASAAVDRLRGLPRESRRALLPHVLHEHPDLAHEPRIRALADELGVDADAASGRPDVTRWLARATGVRATSGADALDRVEQALSIWTTAFAELAAWRAALALEAGFTQPCDALPPDATELLARSVSGDAGAPAVDALVDDVRRLVDASRDAAEAIARASNLDEIESSADVPRWWPRTFRDAALWSRARERARHADTSFEQALRRALDARLRDGR